MAATCAFRQENASSRRQIENVIRPSRFLWLAGHLTSPNTHEQSATTTFMNSSV